MTPGLRALANRFQERPLLKQTKTDALGTRLTPGCSTDWRPSGGGVSSCRCPPRSSDALRMLVRNPHRLVE